MRHSDDVKIVLEPYLLVSLVDHFSFLIFVIPRFSLVCLLFVCSFVHIMLGLNSFFESTDCCSLEMNPNFILCLRKLHEVGAIAQNWEYVYHSTNLYLVGGRCQGDDECSTLVSTEKCQEITGFTCIRVKWTFVKNFLMNSPLRQVRCKS